jgi:DNA-binding NtrC family response regulator
MNVLFIDDEIGFLEVILKRMKKRNIDALGASTVGQALELMAAKPFDVVVLDVKMPGGRSGIDVLSEIKSRWPLIEVIMLTGHAMLEAARDGMQRGAFDDIFKPADLDDLTYKINDAFKKKSLQELKIKHIDKIMKDRIKQ